MASFNLDSLTILPRTLVSGEFGVLFRNGNIAAVNDVAMTTDGASVVRNGGAVSSIFNAAIVATGTGFSLENTGAITGGTSAIRVVTEAENTNVRIVSSGTIHSASIGDAAIELQGHGAMIVNTGQIVSLGGHGISFSDQKWSEFSNGIYNGGHIYARGGGDLAIQGSGASDDIENAGTISGGISTGMGADVIINSGTVTGTISMGLGHDLFEGRTGEVLGVVMGGQGNDTLRGGEAGEELHGGDGDDVLRGGMGDDSLVGDAGSDAIHGASGDDDLSGNNGSDTIFGGGGDDIIDAGRWDDIANGGAGDDTIIGGRGWDTLRGGRGEDVLDGGEDSDRLVGGANADTLTGGDGADVFVLSPGSGHDYITDFVDGEDLVDLSAFGMKGMNDLRNTYNLEESNQGVRIDFGDGDVLVADGIELSELSGDNFIF